MELNYLETLIPWPTGLDLTPPAGNPVMAPTADGTIFNMLTVDRQPSYLYQCLTSMFLGGFTGKLNLYVGQHSTDFLSFIRHHRRIKINEPTVQNMSGKANLVWNWITSVKEEKDYLIVEDDVAFQDAWQERLFDDVLPKIANLGYDNYVLHLGYQTEASPEDYTRNGIIFANKQNVAGTYGMFYTAKAIVKMHAMMQTYFNDLTQTRYRQPTLDIMMRDCFIFGGIRLFFLEDPLLQHIGWTSSLEAKNTVEPIRFTRHP